MATTQNLTKPISFFLGYFFNGFFMAKSISDTESSPTSVFDTKQSFTRFGINPFRFKQNRVKHRKIFEEIKTPFEKLELESENGIALALIQENPNDSVRKVMFGSNLKIQIPSHKPSDQFVFANASPEGGCDFGTKTRNFSDHLTQIGYGSPRASMDALSLSEMELSEDYTKVISYGSNPKTTHIYDNCVVESCCDVVLQSDPDRNPPWQSFLSFCHTCKKNLEDDCDIFMYRGEKAFCSDECRCQEMILDGFMK